MLDNLYGIFIFFVFLGPLVFFHELGHFIFARLAGVRVETFSIGFGPKLATFKRGDTVYAISLIPLGGYVKMFGDDPLSEVELTEEEKAVAYTHKSKWARFWIVFGGPLANFILAFFIYFSLVAVGEKVPETRFGVIPQESEFYQAGFRTGDVLKMINKQEIVSFDDLNLVDTDVESIQIKREGNLVTIPYKTKGIQFIQSFSKYNGLFRAPVFADKNGDFFLIKHANLAANSQPLSVEEYLSSTYTNFNVYKVTSELSFASAEFKFKNLTHEQKESFTIATTKEKNLLVALREQNLYPIDLYISNISSSSAASAAKLRKGDIVIALDGKPIYSFFTDLKSHIGSMKEGESVLVTIVNKEGQKEVKLTPTIIESGGEKILGIGISSSLQLYPVKMIEVKSKGLVSSTIKAWDRTVESTVKTFVSFKRLITGEVSLKQVGGPIAIGQVANDSLDISFSMFFRLMALISINLGIINLFPIPVLDGGHIVFIALEAINGGPLSRKKLQYAQQVGLSLLLILIFVALYNDISRIIF